MGTVVKNLKIEVQSGTSDTLYATWSIASKRTSPTNQVEHYVVQWRYATGDGVYFDGSESNETRQLSTYTPPEHATTVKVRVKPVAKKRKVNGKDKAYFTGSFTDATIKMSTTPPATPGAPSSVEIEDYTLTATLDGITDPNTDQIEFEVFNDAKNKSLGRGIVNVVGGLAVYSTKVGIGGKYRVRCRAINLIGTKTGERSEWSAYSTEQVKTRPEGVSNVYCEVDTETSVKVWWDGDELAEEYEIEYTTESKYFDTSSQTTTETTKNTTHYLTGLDPGYTYFVRVRAKNAQGETDWVQCKEGVILGTKPTIPTTWSSTSTAMVGDKVSLHWIHNSEDGSYQRQYMLEYFVNGGTPIGYTDTTTEDDAKDGYYTFDLDLSGYTDGAVILWRVKTKGIVADYSDWSMQRTIKLYAPPTVTIAANDTLTNFPYSMVITAGPNTQKALKYHIAVIATEDHEIEDMTGTPVIVNKGTEVYSKVFSAYSNIFAPSLLPSDITLENGQTYEIKVTASMDTGLIAEATKSFEVSWSDANYDPEASVYYDEELLCCYISPECTDDDGNFLSGVTLSVYRREYDGTFTEIATNIPNDGAATVTDPHPALDYARYRIVARDNTTSNMGYSDIPSEYIGEPSIVIQWDEKWTDFNYSEESAPETPPWTGSMVKLPYNVDVTENRDPDVSLIEYIGRSHPVSYYGTQRGETASWSTEVPKSDKETIYALRRLAVWRGDVYVREPSGTGYWAQVSVSISHKHKELTVPVTFDITRVEGGK